METIKVDQDPLQVLIKGVIEDVFAFESENADVVYQQSSTLR